MIARYRLVAVLAGVVAASDQLTKRWAQAALPGAPRELIPGWLSLEYAENPGSAFGLFQGAGPIIALLGVGIVGIILGMVRSAEYRTEVWSLGIILGGAIGNLVDRFTRGSGLLDGRVVDWIRLFSIPNFNLADAWINVGIGIMIIHALVVWRRA